jgi:hypothetical protein
MVAACCAQSVGVDDKGVAETQDEHVTASERRLRGSGRAINSKPPDCEYGVRIAAHRRKWFPWAAPMSIYPTILNDA